MTFWDHLEALRWTLVRSFTAIGIFFVGGFAFVPYIFDKVVMAPSRNDFFLYRFLAKISSMAPVIPGEVTKPFHVDIINIKLSSQFFLHISLSLWLALLVAFPYLVYEVWKFVCPALYDNERKGVRFTCSFVTNQLSLDSYMNNFLMLIFMMGIIFELPLVAMLMSKLGFLDRKFFSEYRRHAIVALMFVAAVITPSSDPFTLMAVFIPIYILWELSAFLVKPAPPEDDTEEEESEKEVETLK